MIVANGQPLSTQGFGSFWIWSDKEEKAKQRRRDYRLSARRQPCETCGAKTGEPCVRQTLRGPVARQLPHVGRAPPMHSVTALTNGFNDSRVPKVRMSIDDE